MSAPASQGAPAAASGEKTPAPLLADDGFTRESLMEFDAPPEPPPLRPVPAASIDRSDSEARASAAVHHRHRTHPHPPVEAPPRDLVIKAAHRRNPAESFVYWWNGWVIRNFHTRNGTVLLDRIGAKT